MNMMAWLRCTTTFRNWQAALLLGMSGFAVGNILAKITTALGF